jgi:hypothetical protein
MRQRVTTLDNERQQLLARIQQLEERIEVLYGEPDMHGVIRTDDGAFVLLTVCFEAEDERYRWLNTAICVLEGLISSPITGTGKMRARIYSCVHELD